MKTQLRHAETREAERIGHLAIKAGQHEATLTDAEIVNHLKQLAARFQGSERQADETA